MLARVALRSLRLTPTSVPIQVTLPSFQSRYYAKSNKPKKPLDYIAPTSSNSIHQHGSNAQRTTQQQSDVPFDKPTSTSSHPEYSKLQDDFQTSAPSDNNTEPQSTSPSALDPAEALRQNTKQELTRPLPDLTQGIPSTIDAELASSRQNDGPQSLNITEAPGQPGGQGGGDLPKSAYISSSERRRNRFAQTFYLTALVWALGAGVYLGRNWENDEEEMAHPDAPSGWGLRLFWNRIQARANRRLDQFNQPTFPKLLPDPDPMWERPYTLVLSLEDLLVHSEWSRQHGWRMAKRPGVDYFLRYLSQYYELVIFTSQPSMIAGPIIQKLDPYKVVMWPLFREATKYSGGEYIKVSVASSLLHSIADYASGPLVPESRS